MIRVHFHTFTIRYGFALSCSFTLAAYGEDMCAVLASYWRDRMSFFFSVWQDRGGPGYVFTAVDLQAFVEPRPFVDAFALASGRLKSRMEQLRALKPGAPVF
jgi:hypothetical protein